MIVYEKKIGNAIVKIDNSCVQENTKVIIKNLEMLITNDLAKRGNNKR
ncbi:MAG: hypothetical protein MRZ66_04365 [Clostridiales bacterium]|nr:hypothetical protein [Clostridiales bacterium]